MDNKWQSFDSEEELNVFSQPPSETQISGSLNSSGVKSKTAAQPASTTLDFGDFDDGSSVPESDIGDADTDQLLGDGDQPKTNNSFWTIEYYQQFFDVDTNDVLRRLAGSMVPRAGVNYLQSTIRPNPDLYGPFWVALTLVFATGICGNLSNVVANHIDPEHVPYHFSFKKVTLAATAIFAYWWLLPALLRLVFWWRQSRSNVTFLESICIYGYSLAVYVPISILWLIPNQIFQTILVIIGMILSGSVLVMTFWPTVKDDDKRVAVAIMAGILIFHGLLALGFLLYFFHSPTVSTPSVIPTAAGHVTTVPLPSSKS